MGGTTGRKFKLFGSIPHTRHHLRAYEPKPDSMDAAGLGHLRLMIGTTRVLGLSDLEVQSIVLHVLVFNSTESDQRPIRIHRTTRGSGINADSVEWEDILFEMRAKEGWVVLLSAESTLKGNTPLQVETNGIKVSGENPLKSSTLYFYKKVNEFHTLIILLK